jgi:hypothetical protein
MAPPDLEVVPAQSTGPDWLPARLAATDVAWITEDSVSMLYEALTAGARTGLLAVPQRRAGRVAQGLDRLVADRLVTRYSSWQAGQELTRPALPFDEAGRCADWVVEHWLPGG